MAHGHGFGYPAGHAGQAQILAWAGTLYVINGANDVFAMDVGCCRAQVKGGVDLLRADWRDGSLRVTPKSIAGSAEAELPVGGLFAGRARNVRRDGELFASSRNADAARAAFEPASGAWLRLLPSHARQRRDRRSDAGAALRLVPEPRCALPHAGVYVANGSSPPVFRDVAEPGAKDLQDIVERIALRIGALLEERGCRAMWPVRWTAWAMPGHQVDRRSSAALT